MSSRRGIHERQDENNSESPTRSFNQTGNVSSQRANLSSQSAKIPHEASASSEENESESEVEVEDEHKSPTSSAKKVNQPFYTPECATNAVPKHRPQKVEASKPKIQNPPTIVGKDNGVKHRPQKVEASKTIIQHPPTTVGKDNGVNLKYVLYAIISVLPLLACWQIFIKETPPAPVWKSCNFDALRKQQPLQSPEVWSALKTTNELLLNKLAESPNVFLLLHSDEDRGEKLQKLIGDIALETSKCFDGQQPIEMDLQDFETQDDDDYGYPIEQYKNKLQEGNVFLIVNLNDIPLNAARALHTICDTYSPIAPDVVIFLTLHTDLPIAGGVPSHLAVKTLNKLWDRIPDNELGALITRVTDQVLLLQG
ncbi:uncharacterized protein LOC117569472 isoform X1 [Drosophila albomicans]|uniref:Uncharacterized protein LOC117569472 isoform X1 n=1 Tax=Drosophila albomicans TaxID=7291 RepID=A0A6P8WS57_DROAB|nr:uncharacterized protein LOC117569472 isoform X1 [Drosophila albomicans]